MLKKLLTSTSLLMLALFLISGAVFASPAAASSTEDQQQEALRIIEQANEEIDTKIQIAVAEADILQQSYLQDIKDIEESRLADSLSAKLADLNAKIAAAANSAQKAQLTAAAAEIQTKLNQENAKISADVAELKEASDDLIDQMFTPEGTDSAAVQAQADQLSDVVSIQSALIDARTQVYTAQLDNLITTLYDETLKIADDAIAQAAELGVTAEHFWKLVKIADREVWIDPINVTW